MKEHTMILYGMFSLNLSGHTNNAKEILRGTW